MHCLSVDLEQSATSLIDHFRAKCSNVYWLQLLKCEYLLVFFVIYDSKLFLFFGLLVRQKKQEFADANMGSGTL